MEQQKENLRKQSSESQQNSQRQLREVRQREENSQRQLRGMKLEKENLQSQLRETQQREQTLQRQLRDLQENSQKQSSEMQQRAMNLERQFREKQQREENLQRQLSELQEKLRREMSEMQQRENNLQRQLWEIQQQEETLQRQRREFQQNSQRQLNEMQKREEDLQRQLREMPQRDWEIQRNEIQMTDKCLGRGGWGSVVEGTYCGCPVAVLSPNNFSLLEREINIASMCRHPHLLQFIGATNDEGNPLFVTELMEKSLRTLLEQRQLSETEIAVISLDVARALNYLHQKKPEPIIHSNVSSASVLLWRQGDQWRAKVSNYGPANFMQQTMTVAPGAVVYSAPEALPPNQTAEVSFLCIYNELIEDCLTNPF